MRHHEDADYVKYLSFAEKGHEGRRLKLSRGFHGFFLCLSKGKLMPKYGFVFILATMYAFFMGLFPGFNVSSSVTFASEGRIIEKDTDEDGKIDQIAHLNAEGDLILLELDSNADGKMDAFQYYEDKKAVRLEKDTDGDGQIDRKDYLKNDKRCRHEKLNALGKIVGAIDFDDRERPVTWKRDSTGDGKLDSTYRYREGKLHTLTRDTTGDGRINIFQEFQNDSPVERKVDRNGDGQWEEIVYFDATGRPKKSEHDTDRNGKMDNVRLYDNGELIRQEWNLKGKNNPERIVEYDKGTPVLEKKDSDGNGKFELVIRYKNGKPLSRDEDTDKNGKMDRFTKFDSTGAPMLMEEDRDGNGKIDRISRYKNNQLVYGGKQRTVRG